MCVWFSLVPSALSQPPVLIHKCIPVLQATKCTVTGSEITGGSEGEATFRLQHTLVYLVEVASKTEAFMNSFCIHMQLHEVVLCRIGCIHTIIYSTVSHTHIMVSLLHITV